MRQAPSGLTLEQAAVWSAAHSMSGCDERWEKRRATGLTDTELREALAYEFGIAGGRPFPREYPEWEALSIWYTGGENPNVRWRRFGENDADGTPIETKLAGRALIAAARVALVVAETPTTTEAPQPPAAPTRCCEHDDWLHTPKGCRGATTCKCTRHRRKAA